MEDGLPQLATQQQTATGLRQVTSEVTSHAQIPAKCSDFPDKVE